MIGFRMLLAERADGELPRVACIRLANRLIPATVEANPRFRQLEFELRKLARLQPLPTPQNCLLCYASLKGAIREPLENASKMDRGGIACRPRHNNSRNAVGAAAPAVIGTTFDHE